ncbi:unnamed protein product [Darwinula stevensoni]|uniref:Large ribosomal subunit protein uL18m n=1 Tax=Darwinula stevensoni TaxID=69355 RepID=A0A7R8X1F0_9CRUS|nr:unnamed protein product [Darwinula stevensoni]CAG0882727.1 unnamed protein product [Darwinula stevensoni]
MASITNSRYLTLLLRLTKNVTRPQVARVSQTTREFTENDNISPMVVNRNPRNLERLRIAQKPRGWQLEADHKEFWHRLVLQTSARHLTAKLEHNSGKTVIFASTQEWCIRKFLYTTNDVNAWHNLGRVFVHRCLQAGFHEFHCDVSDEERKRSQKVDSFLKALEEGGVSLQEPPRYFPAQMWDELTEEKPWEIHEHDVNDKKLGPAVPELKSL